jgi:hypothetical protein
MLPPGENKSTPDRRYLPKIVMLRWRRFRARKSTYGYSTLSTAPELVNSDSNTEILPTGHLTARRLLMGSYGEEVSTFSYVNLTLGATE